MSLMMIKLIVQAYNSHSYYKNNALFYKTLFISLCGIKCVPYLQLSLLYEDRLEKSRPLKRR